MTVAQLIELLNRIPDEFRDLQVQAEYDGRHSEITFVVLDPTGVSGRRIGGVFLVHGSDQYIAKLGLVRRYSAPADSGGREPCPKCQGSKEVFGMPTGQPDTWYPCPRCHAQGWIYTDGRPPELTEGRVTP